MKKIFLLYLVFFFSCQNNSDSRVTNSLSAKDTSLKTITIKDAEASNTLKNFMALDLLARHSATSALLLSLMSLQGIFPEYTL